MISHPALTVAMPRHYAINSNSYNRSLYGLALVDNPKQMEININIILVD